MALHEAAGDDDALDASFLLGLDGIADDGERFVFAGFEEAAGVDDDASASGSVLAPPYEAQPSARVAARVPVGAPLRSPCSCSWS
jgi:hypothetical protein